MEKRDAYFKTAFKTRAADDGAKYIEGYFAVFNQETELWQGTFEQIAPGAFDTSLEKNDIRCLFNHNSDVVLGRTGNGTLTLRADAHGLFGSVRINEEDKQALDIYARVERGDIDGCSFGFWPTRQEYEDRPDDTTLWTVIDADTIEVSVVTFPAYPQTAVTAAKRSFDAARAENRDAKIARIKQKMEAKK